MTARAEEILNSGNDKALLKMFRDETTLIVLMVRVRNEERKAAAEELYGPWPELPEVASLTPLFEEYKQTRPGATQAEFLDHYNSTRQGD